MSFLIYYLILAIIPIWAQLKVKNTYSKYEKVANASGMTGAEVARMILDENGLYHVKVLEHSGFLSDHYNPINKTGQFVDCQLPRAFDCGGCCCGARMRTRHSG